MPLFPVLLYFLILFAIFSLSSLDASSPARKCSCSRLTTALPSSTIHVARGRGVATRKGWRYCQHHAVYVDRPYNYCTAPVLYCYVYYYSSGVILMVAAFTENAADES